MSGTISFSPAVRWSAASWLFDWVLKSVAGTVQDAELAAELIGIVDENIGWFALDDLADDQSADVRRVICDSLKAAAEQGLPDTMAGRTDVLKHIDDLIRISSDTS
jgi:hypothetical protein